MADSDSAKVAALFTDIGFVTTAEAMVSRIANTRVAGGNVLVSELGDGIVGCVGIASMLPPHRDAPVGRITILVVEEGHRRTGIGLALVREAVLQLRADGCTLIEVTSRFELEDAHRFYEALGFEKTSVRLALRM
jgi:GNAT superfamily N-acetyltransferase